VRSLQAFISTASGRIARFSTSYAASSWKSLATKTPSGTPTRRVSPIQGTKSVGVKRQYNGILGRSDNCQVAVFANYCPAKGHAFFVSCRSLIPRLDISGSQRSKSCLTAS
jgi:SRSO17 transposase